MKKKLIYIMILSFFVFFTATTSLTSPGSASAQSPTNTPINIGNFVRDDLDQDGTQDTGEPGLAGVSVQLWNSAKNQLINTPTPTRTPTPINIGNFVWDDLDQDGTQDAGEPGLAGVSVQLWNAAKNQLINSTSTSASGAYSLVAPIPGNYRVRVVLPSASDAFSPKDAAVNDQTDSDINPSGVDLGFTDTFNIASNVISTTIYDAGIIKFRTPTPTRTPTPINIGNFVWDDLDQDGTQDAGEPGLAGVSVQLWNAAKNQLINSTSTSASGAYSLVAPIPGNYRVRVVLPSASDAFSPKDAAVNDQTDSDINPSGVDLGFTDTFNIASNVISTTIYDAGIIKFRTPTPTRTPTPINIGNFVWDDLDQDGTQDAGEPGLAGVSVQLWNSAKNQLINSTSTSASGAYSLVAPIPGNYRVRVVLPSASDAFSPKDAAVNDQTDSDINPSGVDLGFTDTFNIASNVISTTIYDAGIIKFKTPTPTRTPTPINIGNFVWDDLDQDGTQDAGEPGLAGVSVQLWNSAKNQLINSTSTSASGAYTLVAPIPGNYRVRVVLPSASDAFSPKDAAVNDQTDSDINPSGVDLGFTDTFNIASNVISTTIYDAGIISATFTDVPLTYWANSYIERLYNAGITGGCSAVPLMYCPASPVTRAQMAIFLLRGMYGSDYVPPVIAATRFNDVPVNSFGAAWIEQLAVEGITSGCGSGNYCPNTAVTRAQMAVFLVRASHGIAFTPPAATGIFLDVPIGSFGADYIEQLSTDAITSGCGGGNYCPATLVKRDQMAVFLVKAFNLP